jgi:hypothetical protein
MREDRVGDRIQRALATGGLNDEMPSTVDCPSLRDALHLLTRSAAHKGEMTRESPVKKPRRPKGAVDVLLRVWTKKPSDPCWRNIATHSAIPQLHVACTF